MGLVGPGSPYQPTRSPGGSLQHIQVIEISHDNRVLVRKDAQLSNRVRLERLVFDLVVALKKIISKLLLWSGNVFLVLAQQRQLLVDWTYFSDLAEAE